VADRVLLFCAHFSKGLAEGIKPEEGIVSESAVSSGIEEDLTGTIAGSDNGISRERLSFGDDADDRRNESCASVCYSLKIFEKLFVILLIVARLACVSRRINAGGTVKSVYDKSRVIGNSRKTRKLRCCARFDKSILLKSFSVLNDIAFIANVIEGQKFNFNVRDILGKKLMKLFYLSAVSGC
jgi:hypothetical protein